MQTALVTGGCGFVGRHLVHRLVDMGVDTYVVDDLSTGKPFGRTFIGPRQTFVKDDVRNFFHNAEPIYDVIFHLAAVVGGRQKIESDPLAVATDLSIDAEFFNWLARSQKKPRRIVYFSSSAAYPYVLQLPAAHCQLSESMISFSTGRIGRPDMTYGWSKLTGEYLAREAVAQYDIPVVIYRPFSGYGEDQDPAYPFPAICGRAFRRENPLVLWGDGEQVRDWVHIDDVIDCVLHTFAKLQPGDVLNIGTGVGTSMRALAEEACIAAGYKPPIQTDPTKPAGVHYRVADTYKLHQLWRHKISLQEGVLRMHQWQLARSLDKSGVAV